ncbi:MAG: hypothetical protein AB7O52_11225 [Planctomycetota bacterium]
MKQCLVWLGLAFLCTTPVAAQCNPGNGIGGTGPDVVVGELTSPNNYGSAGGVFAYSIGTTSCNIGTTPLLWISGGNQHPVIGQVAYRILNGRFEQIGNSWLKQGFTALQGNTCENDGTPSCNCAPNPNGAALGVGCSDPYSAGLNGSQGFGALSARSEVRAAHRGYYTPVTLQPSIADVTSRRLRITSADLNTGGIYVVEGQYVTADDALNGNGHNSTSYRLCTFGATGNRNLSYSGGTVRQLPAITVWGNNGATLQDVFTGENPQGRLITGYNVVDNGNGTWTYNYSIYNLNSTRGVSSFEVPLPTGVTLSDIGFRDAEYHSGDTINGTDWNVTQAAGSITWDMVPVGGNVELHNFIRWGSAYSFWFTANAAPAAVVASFDLYLTSDPQNGTAFPAPNFRTVTVMGPSGTFVAPPANLSCNVSGFNANLNWTNGEPYTAIEITRGGVVIATLGGGATSFTDPGLAPGSYSYGVSGVTLAGQSVQATCGVTVVVPPVAGLICNGSVTSTALSWVNGTTYTSIDIRRDGFTITTLPGTSTSFTDTGVAAGAHTYAVIGRVGASSAAAALCNVTVLPTPSLDFDVFAENVTTSYNQASGIGNFDVSVMLIENAGSPNFPNEVAGFSVALGNDSSVLNPTAFDLGAPILAMNGGAGPSFHQASVATNGVTLGVVFDFMGMAVLSASALQELGVVSYDTNPATLAGNAVGALTTLDFVDFTLGQSVENVVVVGVDAIHPSFNSGVVSLQPMAGGAFRRGDCNVDGTTNIADAVFLLSFLFPVGPAPTLGCQSACDANDDGQLNIADAVRVLDALFGVPASPLPAPIGACGVDPTPDALTCDNYMGC